MLIRSPQGFWLHAHAQLDLEPTALLVLRMAISWELLSPHARVVFHFSVAVYRFSLHRWQGIGGFTAQSSWSARRMHFNWEAIPY